MLLGSGSDYTPEAKRLITYAVGTSSYRHACEALKEFGCFYLSHQTVGDIAVAVAGEIETKLKGNPAVRKEFQKAKGETEFTTDGAFVNTRKDDGEHEWREMKVAVVSKRERGESALPEEWDKRDLPEPSISIAVAAIESKPEFQERCKGLRRTLGAGGALTVLGDGAACQCLMTADNVVVFVRQGHRVFGYFSRFGTSERLCEDIVQKRCRGAQEVV